ncbi:MAG: tRNA (N(6)-L-threonylcarbamoyladenosine(37)-C(2))-methylthiotransferase MtaB [Candidatus Gorgyraea atricola]|nr:tRNA (N(6)-L-threonylcarbamoyladenosine(37)-C(2))-methylthiotransferase MtaB [Candidatus Gorgyraea atricola]
MTKKAFYIKTLGCKVNQYESQVIRENFLKQGYIEAENIDEADICVINSCTVTSTSDSKSLRLIRNAIKQGKCVVATGCMVEGAELDLSKFGGVRFIVRNKNKYKIPELIGGPRTSRFAPVRGKQGVGISGLKGHTRVFVKVQDGCDNVCSYCKVRVVRGYSRSRPLKEVLDECTTIIKNGTKEIVLTGICLGAYGRDISTSLSTLINDLCRIKGDWRLRLSSIEPKDVDKDLLKQFQAQKKICRHLHLPFQSGDDHVLKRMRRPYKGSDYLNIVQRIKDAVPDIAISTDIMVGFPGETEKRFKNTMDFLNIVRPMRMHIFPFSKRSGTGAYDFKDQVNSVTKKKREDKLVQLAQVFTNEFTNNLRDKDVEVLVEDKRSRDGHLQGYTGTYIKVYLPGPDTLKGQFVKRKRL